MKIETSWRLEGFNVYQFVVLLFYLSAKQHVLHHSSADSKANLHFRFLHNFEWRRTVWIPRFPQSYYVGLDTCEYACMQVSDWVVLVKCEIAESQYTDQYQQFIFNFMSRFWVWKYLKVSVIPKYYSKVWSLTWVGDFF